MSGLLALLSVLPLVFSVLLASKILPFSFSHSLDKIYADFGNAEITKFTIAYARNAIISPIIA